MSTFNEIKKPIIYLITKGNLTEGNFRGESANTLQIIESAIESNISLIQIREKQLRAKLIFALALKAVNLAKNTTTKVLINERFDIALATSADGVHLTSNSIPTEIVRQIVPRDFIVGVSTHSLEKAKQSRDRGADFVTYSPIFVTRSKVNYGETKGLVNLNDVCGQLGKFPVLALGGVHKENYQSVIENGASGFAGISFLNDVANLEELKKLKHGYG